MATFYDLSVALTCDYYGVHAQEAAEANVQMGNRKRAIFSIFTKNCKNGWRSTIKKCSLRMSEPPDEWVDRGPRHLSGCFLRPWSCPLAAWGGLSSYRGAPMTRKYSCHGPRDTYLDGWHCHHAYCTSFEAPWPCGLCLKVVSQLSRNSCRSRRRIGDICIPKTSKIRVNGSSSRLRNSFQYILLMKAYFKTLNSAQEKRNPITVLNYMCLVWVNPLPHLLTPPFWIRQCHR